MSKLARIGLLIPPGNVAMETEFPRYLPDEVVLHTTRVFRPSTEVTYDGLLDMLNHAVPAATLLARAHPDVIVYGCTSGSLLGGVATNLDVTRRIEDATRIRTVTTATAVTEAIFASGAKTVFLATPYIDELNAAEVRYLEQENIRVTGVCSLVGRTSEEIRAISPKAIVDLVMRHEAQARQADALFISCTNLHVMGVVDWLEKQLGKPVITSNQATLRAALSRVGRSPRVGKSAGALLR